MLQQYLHIISQIFYVSPWIIGIVSAIILIGMVLIALVDALYRPNMPQSPYNFILDRLIPSIFILCPVLLVLNLKLEKFSLSEKFGIMVLLHIVILTPVLHCWSSLRSWRPINNTSPFNLWENPKIFLDIACALIYVYLWGSYFILLRYLNQGHKINVFAYITAISGSTYITIGIILMFFWAFYIPWCYLVFKGLRGLREYCWLHFINIVRSLIILLLKYTIVFYILELLYKISVVWIIFIIRDPFVFKRKNKLHKLIHYIYLKPKYLIFFLTFCGLMECLFCKGIIYYIPYLFVIVLFVRYFLYIPNNFGNDSDIWIGLCCYSNYLTNKWSQPYYKKQFWLSFNDIREHFNNLPQLDRDIEIKVQAIIASWEKYVYDTYDRDHYIYKRLCLNNKTSLYHKLRLTYKRYYV